MKLKYTENGAVPSIFENFLSKVSAEIDGPLYVIIDEYDHFANELLSFKTEMFSDIISKTGFVRKWYEVLKKGTESIIKRIFATGVSPITLDSLTSGFNIASDITRHPYFNEMMGFNKNEVIELVNKTIKKPMQKEEISLLIETLKNNYNGYLFSEDCSERLFNSDMILYYLQSFVELQKPPKSIVDKNIASDYGKLGSLFDLKNKSQTAMVLKDILEGKKIRCRITEGFSLEKDFSQDDFKSLLFYIGMLTIDRELLDRVILKVPNYAIKGLYFNYFAKKLSESTNYEIDVTEIEDAVTEIALEGKNASLVKIVEKTLNKMSNRDFIKFDEKYVKLIFLTYCFLSKIYLVKSEYEVNGEYIDIALLKQVNVNPNYFAIFELKYITRSEYEKQKEKLVNEKKEEAVRQINEYVKSDELKSIKNLKKWALVFVNDKCIVNEEIK